MRNGEDAAPRTCCHCKLIAEIGIFGGWDETASPVGDAGVQLALCVGLEAQAQTGSDEATIRATITAQVEAWNRADIPAFMQAYEDSPETTFIGANIGKGYETDSGALPEELHHP